MCIQYNIYHEYATINVHTSTWLLWPTVVFSTHTVERYPHPIHTRSRIHGRVLALNGVVYCTEKDEPAVNELMAHIPLFSHPLPETVSLLLLSKLSTTRDRYMYTACQLQLVYCMPLICSVVDFAIGATVSVYPVAERERELV